MRVVEGILLRTLYSESAQASGTARSGTLARTKRRASGLRGRS